MAEEFGVRISEPRGPTNVHPGESLHVLETNLKLFLEQGDAAETPGLVHDALTAAGFVRTCVLPCLPGSWPPQQSLAKWIYRAPADR